MGLGVVAKVVVIFSRQEEKKSLYAVNGFRACCSNIPVRAQMFDVPILRPIFFPSFCVFVFYFGDVGGWC